MYQSILVPLDGSPFAEHALPLALSIARRANASLELVYVHLPLAAVYPEGLPVLDDVFISEVKTKERAYLENVARRVSGLSGGPVTQTVLEGPIATTIRKHAISKGVDLVVMTTHARSMLGRLWLGSVADNLVRELPMPLLLVRPAEGQPTLEPEQVLRHILVPLDGSELAEQIIEPVVALGSLMDADYTLLRVLPQMFHPSPGTPGTVATNLSGELLAGVNRLEAQLEEEARKYLERVAYGLRKRSLHVSIRIESERQPALAILEAAKAPAIDMVALETHGRRGVPRLMLGSVADKVVRGTSLPILVQRPVH